MLPLPLMNPSPSDTEEGPAEPPYPETIVVDPQVLWLPPSRIGQDVDNPEQLFRVTFYQLFIVVYHILSAGRGKCSSVGRDRRI